MENKLFKKIEIKDLDKLNTFFINQKYRLCDFTILATYMWIDYFNLEYYIHDEILYIRSNNVSNIEYFMPLSYKYNVVECIDKLFEISLVNELSFCIIIEEEIENIKEKYSVNIVYNRNWSDYLYKYEDLLYLEGKEYKDKRRHIKQFLLNYNNASYKLINTNEINIIIKFQELFINDDDNFLARYENEQVLRVLNNIDLSNLYIGVLYIGNILIGYSIGEIIDDTLFIHVEKALKEYIGSYQMLNNVLLKLMKDKKDINYINRGEDVGDEGLRVAKLSYKPCKMINKYNIKLIK